MINNEKKNTQKKIKKQIYNNSDPIALIAKIHGALLNSRL